MCREWFSMNPQQNGVNMYTIVQESHATLPINLYSGYVLSHTIG